MILEASVRAGGWCHTEYKEQGFSERGPRTFAAARTPELLGLVQELGLAGHIRWAPKCSQKRFLWDGSQMHSVPPSLRKILVTPLFRQLMWELLQEGFRPPKPWKEESLQEFLRRRFGPAAATLCAPIVQGIWAGDPHLLDASACLGGLVRAEQEQGGIVRNAIKSLFNRVRTAQALRNHPGGLWTLEQGMGQLIATLVHHVGASLELGQRATRITTEHGVWKVQTMDQHGSTRSWQGSHLWVCVPNHTLRRIPGPWNEPPALSMETLRVIDCIWDRPDILPQGFGYLCLSPRQEPLLGAVYDSACFPHQMRGRSKATLMQGGACQEAWLQHPSAVAEAVRGFCRHTGLAAPDHVHGHLAPHAIAQHHVGIQRQMLQWQQELQHLPPVQFLGSSWGGAAVEDCVRTALMQSKEAGGYARSVAVPGYIQKTSSGAAQGPVEPAGIDIACPQPTRNRSPC